MLFGVLSWRCRQIARYNLSRPICRNSRSACCLVVAGVFRLGTRAQPAVNAPACDWGVDHAFDAGVHGTMSNATSYDTDLTRAGAVAASRDSLDAILVAGAAMTVGVTITGSPGDDTVDLQYHRQRAAPAHERRRHHSRQRWRRYAIRSRWERHDHRRCRRRRPARRRRSGYSGRRERRRCRVLRRKGDCRSRHLERRRQCRRDGRRRC